MTIAQRRLTAVLTGFIILAGMTWLELMVQKKHYLIGGGVSRSFLFVLINLHIAVIIGLLYLIIRNSIKLFLERRRRMPGSVFKTNLLFAFVLFSVIPSFFVFFTAGRFITKSIDRWFDVHVGKGFVHAKKMHVYHTQHERVMLNRYGSLIAQYLSHRHIGLLYPLCALKQTIPGLDAYTVYVVNHSSSGIDAFIRHEIGVWRSFRTVNDRTTNSLRVRFVRKLHDCVKPQMFDFYGSLYWIAQVGTQLCVLAYRYPEPLRSNLIGLEGAYNDYDQVLTLQSVIYWNYAITFILITLLILFLSIWCAIYLAKGIGKPIQDLLDATNKVRQGQWDTRVELYPSSDLQTLATGFNEMTSAVQLAHVSLERKNREMLAILEHISAAVLLVNRYGRVIFYNNAARELIRLHAPTETLMYKKMWFLGVPLMRQGVGFVRTLLNKQPQQLMQEATITWGGSQRVFRVYGTLISGVASVEHDNRGLLLVIDDLTDVVKINKMRTWQEAAKQMAHEIKNPLTPIQLATQRMQRKFKSVLAQDQHFIDCTNTILHQVHIIKDLVTTFAEFASLPLPHFETTDLAAVVSELFNVYQLSYPGITFIVTVETPSIIIKTDKKKIKRVLINLLENSIRALQYIEGSQQITCMLRYAPNGKSVEILFSDNGPGIPLAVKETLFLPNISTEKKNMGLGLAIVHDSILQLGGVIRLVPSDVGAAFQIVLPI